MLQNYWPWSRVSDARPRGLRNLRLEEIFPQQDYESAKRYVGTLDAGKMSGNSERIGKKCGRTREDPILRFQFGSKDLRKYVDNNLRYKTNKEEQMEYKKQLDEMVEEKKKRQKKEKMKEREFNAVNPRKYFEDFQLTLKTVFFRNGQRRNARSTLI